jgi:hypothetical protein
MIGLVLCISIIQKIPLISIRKKYEIKTTAFLQVSANLCLSGGNDTDDGKLRCRCATSCPSAPWLSAGLSLVTVS